jgi:hypothetical protein
MQKIYAGDPLVCLRYRGALRITRLIEDPSVIQAILP